MAGPGHGLQAFLLHLTAAMGTFTKVAFVHALQRFFHQLQNEPLVVALAEEELLGLGVGSLVGGILRGLLIGGPAVLFDARNNAAQLLLFLLQALAERLQALLVRDHLSA